MTRACASLGSWREIRARSCEIARDLSRSPGVAQAESLSTVWFVEGEGTDDQLMRFRGTPSAVNAALRGALYRSLHEGNDTLSLHIADPAGSELRLAGTIELSVGPPRPFATIPDEIRFPSTGLIAVTIALVSTLLLAVSRLLEASPIFAPLFAPEASRAGFGLLDEDNATAGDGAPYSHESGIQQGIQLPEGIQVEPREAPQGAAQRAQQGSPSHGASRESTRNPIPSSPVHALSPDVSPGHFSQPQRPNALPHPIRLPSPRRDRGGSVSSSKRHSARYEDRSSHDARSLS